MFQAITNHEMDFQHVDYSCTELKTLNLSNISLYIVTSFPLSCLDKLKKMII